MTSTTPATPSRSDARRCRRHPAMLVPATALIAAVVVLAVTGAEPAGAQSATTLAPTTTLPAENPNSTAAGIVFFAVTGVIIVGALVLYLRNRRPKVPTATDG